MKGTHILWLKEQGEGEVIFMAKRKQEIFGKVIKESSFWENLRFMRVPVALFLLIESIVGLLAGESYYFPVMIALGVIGAILFVWWVFDFLRAVRKYLH